MQEIMKEMVEAHGDSVYRLALRYTGNCSIAQDITQETFLKAFKRINSFDQDKPAKPWLLKIAGNLCKNYLRDNREIPVDFIEAMEKTDQANPEQLYINQERDTELMRAVKNLPDKYREVIMLKHVNELSYSEICEVLGLELSLVKNRLYRGRLMLKDTLIKQGGMIG